MGLVRYDNNPTSSDTVLLELVTKNYNGIQADPYKVNSVTVYYLERGVASSAVYQEFASGDGTDVVFANAVPVKVYGNEGNPAWLSSDTADAQITHVTTDAAGDAQVGVFTAEWNPEFNREGDYFVCWTWTPTIGGSTTSEYNRFFLQCSPRSSTFLPQNLTPTDKYDTLMERYLPATFKEYISDADVTPDVLRRLNSAVGQAFADTENKANQILGLQDANTVHDSLLPYLANFFNWKLKSDDPNLWRRQIKQAVPLYKQKGTYKGLREALAESGITLTKVTRFWQVVSKSTWQEAFRVEEDNQDSFTLAKIPMAYDAANFELKFMPANSNSYTTLSYTDVSFTVDDGVAYMDWIGDFELAKDDIIKVLYKVKPVADQSVEDYIRSLPLADNRSEAVMRDNNICYPKKNWNVRLIADDDVMLPVICPTRHPYHVPVVFGKVRTEFPYSENIYNMDEYNGSTRDSLDPCDIDRDFLDECPCCMSSKISVDVEVANLSNDRMVECQEVLREFLPFHAVVHSINFDGSVEEFILPPVEEVQTYMVTDYVDNVINGQMAINRTIQPWTDNLKREMLATANNLATATTGKGFNLAYSLYYTAEAFDHYTMGLDMTDNLLEILSGLNAGSYQVGNPDGHYIDFDYPSLVPSPFDKTQFPFRLSNKLYEGGGNIYQDDKFLLSDPNLNFTRFNVLVAKDSGTPWQVEVAAGPQAGTYDIYDLLPDGTVQLLGWPTTTTVNNVAYSLLDENGDEQDAGTTGKVVVHRRGRYESTDNLVQEYLIEPGFYVSYLGTQYKIAGFKDDSKCYIDGYTGGNVVGASSVKIYKRVIDNGVGYVRPRGLMLSTVANYYDALQVSDQLEDDQHMENFLVLVGTDYYQIASWSDTANGEGRYEIVLNGTPLHEWGTSGTTGLTFSVIQFLKTTPVSTTKTFPTVVTTTLDRMDRRGNDVIFSSTETDGGMSAAMAAAMLNALNSGSPFDLVSHGENISIQIEYKE